MPEMPSEKLLFDYSAPNTLLLKLSGDWSILAGLPSIDEVTPELNAHPQITQITLDPSGMSKWDSSLIFFLLSLMKAAEGKNIRLITDALPQNAQKLLAIALRVRGKSALPHKITPDSFLERIGERFLSVKESAFSLLDFLGEIAAAFGRLIRGKSYFRGDDFIFTVQRCGIDALPLVSLISVLVGMILAFIGAIQLKLFGAQIFIADIVGIAMVRVMGAVMTGILMSGRTGASFAAELGIMQINDEVDALKTLGVAPVDFLVVPRILALVIMMPLLTLYADLMGILGGFIVSTGVLNINPVEYLHHTQHAVKLNNLWVGLTHSLAFGVIIAVAGCFRGIKCERSAAGLGEATTSAVVLAIVGIVIATAVIIFICQILGV